MLGRDIDLRIREDNEACIIVATKGFSPKLRHVKRTQKVDVGSLGEFIRSPDVDISYINTDDQIADIFTKGLDSVKWCKAVDMLNVSSQLSSEVVSETSEGGVERIHTSTAVSQCKTNTPCL